MARSLKALVPTQRLLLSDFNALVLSRDISDELVNAYFRTFESIYRVLHEPTFYREYLRYWLDPAVASQTFVATLLLVMAIGSVFYQDESHELSVRNMAKQWVHVTQSWLNGPFEKSRLNLGCLQVHCLLLLARQVCAVGADLVWISDGTLIRTAMQMGLHRDPKFFPKIPVLEAELRRRLWATILELDIQSALDSGMPPLISFDDFDCEPPANINDSDIDENTKAIPKPKPPQVFTQCSMQILLSRSLPIRVEIARLLNDFRSDSTYEQTLTLGTGINSHVIEATRFMDTILPRPSVLRRNLLDLHNRRFLLSLHIPFAIRAKTDPHYYFSRKIVFETCIHLLTYSGTDDSIPATPVSNSNRDDDFTRLRNLADGLFRGAMHATVAFCLEFIDQVKEEKSSAGTSLVPRTTLHSILDHIIQTSKRRLELGETNVKGIAFMSMIQAQIKAMESGEDAEKAILDAANRATDEAYEILQNNVKQTSQNDSSGVLINAPEGQAMGWDMTVCL